ncbi:peptidyl-tRNA hydrolase PTH2-domain-containing protein [Leptodontidium sp. MPI-SDFR-AT-0119]|nr:peptidyl-tRNA hydrolase PTH2-domain-containing protein [Leptodontidium sp. MPI-SDFR-AT-0119]
MADRAPPTPLAMIIGTALIAGISGYLFGIGSGLGIFPNPFVAKEPRKRGIANYDDEEESEEEDIDASILDHAPNWANGFEADKRDGLRVTSAAKTKEVKKEGSVKKEPGFKQEPGSEWEDVQQTLEDTGEECKMVLVVRTDLGMTKGKIAAQCGHATLACYKHFLEHDPKSKILRRWERGGQMKIALQAKSEKDLDTLQATAISLGLVAEVIADAGRTQIASGSHTVLGIGPGPASVINQVTGTLKLL